MKRDKRKLDELESRLFVAYRESDDGGRDGGWRESAMREIRALGAAETPNGVQAQIGRIAWRFSAAACVIALMLLAYVYSNGFVDYQELAQRFLEYPIEFII